MYAHGAIDNLLPNLVFHHVYLFLGVLGVLARDLSAAEASVIKTTMRRAKVHRRYLGDRCDFAARAVGLHCGASSHEEVR
jgi:hypothetical protein